MGIYKPQASRGTLKYQYRVQRVGVVALDIMKGDVKDWTSRYFHMDYFITEYLFSAALV